jgi:hypothetical protein
MSKSASRRHLRDLLAGQKRARKEAKKLARKRARPQGNPGRVKQ